jgi:flagellar protein FlaG
MEILFPKTPEGTRQPDSAIFTGNTESKDKAKTTEDKAKESQQSKSEKMQQILAGLQEQLESMNISLRFSHYGKNNEKVSVVIVEKESGKVIREIPSESIQNLSEKLDDMVGVMLNTSA